MGKNTKELQVRHDLFNALKRRGIDLDTEEFQGLLPDVIRIINQLEKIVRPYGSNKAPIAQAIYVVLQKYFVDVHTVIEEEDIDLEVDASDFNRNFRDYDVRSFYREEWKLTTEETNILFRKIIAPWQVFSMSDEDLLAIRNLGKMILSKIRRFQRSKTKQEWMSILEKYHR